MAAPVPAPGLGELAAAGFAAAGSAEGMAWIAAVPSLIASLARQWNLTIDSEEFRHGYNAVVLPVGQGGRPRVLKLAWPPDRVRGEAAALAAWQARGAVELVACDVPRGALLLERLDASRSLASIPLTEAAAVAGALIRTLAIEASGSFPLLQATARQLAATFGARQRSLGHPVPGQWITLAARLAADLARDPGRRLVHTDLHYGNILVSERAGQPWVAIDPAAAAGTPERSTAELLWTRADELSGPGAITGLLDLLVENGQLDRAKAVAWGFVRSIDYWLWGLENGLTTDPLRCQRIASALAPAAEPLAIRADDGRMPSGRSSPPRSCKEDAMVKIALDPAMYHATMSVPDELRKAADLGYEYLELSPRADWFFWHRYPKADSAMIAEVNQAVKETGVRISSLVPVFGWSSPDEQERQAQVRNWKRLLEIADGLGCPVIMTELSGDPNQPLKSEHAFYHSMEELIPAFEQYDLQLNIEAHPYDFSERNDDAVQIVRGLNRPWINYCFCIPHAFHLSDGAGDMRDMISYARPKLAHVHVADCYNHRANVGNRYIVNPPGADVRVHQHNEIGNGDIDWDQTFTALRDASFDGIAAVCVFGWEEDADAIHRRMLERVTAELARPGHEPQ